MNQVARAKEGGGVTTNRLIEACNAAALALNEAGVVLGPLRHTALASRCLTVARQCIDAVARAEGGGS